MTPRHALIIGGGIAGPATAIALQRAGIEATVYEARDRTVGDGVMLTVATNGIDALRTIGADQTVLLPGFPTPSITLRNHAGQRLGQTRTGGRLADGTLSHTIKRAHLHRALQEEATRRGVRIERGKRLVHADQTGSVVRARFADGSEAVGDVLIGCDGVHSTVRALIDPRSPAPRYAGLLNTGGFASGVELDVEPGSYEMIFGQRAFFGYVPAPDGETLWFANLPHRREPQRGELTRATTEQLRARMHELYAGDSGPARALIGATAELPPTTPIHTVPHLPTWHRGRMLVIGDAAHAPSPTSGQGASLSFEDAVTLAMCLRDRAAPQDAFATFERLRRRRVERIIRAAARINSNKAPGRLGRLVRDAMLPTVLRLTANAKSATEVFDYHLDWDSDVTEPAPEQIP